MGTVDIINNIMDKYYFTEEIKDDEELKAILKKEIDKSSFLKGKTKCKGFTPYFL